MSKKIQKGELQRLAKGSGVDPKQTYRELRNQIEINECKQCGGEFVNSVWGEFCSDSCQVQYRND